MAYRGRAAIAGAVAVWACTPAEQEPPAGSGGGGGGADTTGVGASGGATSSTGTAGWGGTAGSGGGGGATCANAPAWSKRYGEADTSDAVLDLAVDAQGNVFMLYSRAFPQVLPLTMTLVKLGPHGDELWSRQVAGSLASWSGFLDTDESGNVALGVYFDEVTVCGTTLSTTNWASGLVVVYDADGNCVGGTTMEASPGGWATVDGLAFDAVGKLFVGGSYSGILDLGMDPLLAWNDAFLLKTSVSGAASWNLGLDGFWLGDISVEGTGNLVVSGSSDDTGQLGGIQLGPTDGPYVLVAKLDPSGQALFAQSCFSTIPESTTCYSTVTPSGDILLAGQLTDLYNTAGDLWRDIPGQIIHLAALDPNGALIWSRSLENGEPTFARGVASDAQGNAYFTGAFGGTLDFGGGALSSGSSTSDMFVAVYDATGAPIWTQAYGSDGELRGMRMAVDPCGGVVVAGDATGAVDFGDGELAPIGDRDVFVTRLLPP